MKKSLFLIKLLIPCFYLFFGSCQAADKHDEMVQRFRIELLAHNRFYKNDCENENRAYQILAAIPNDILYKAIHANNEEGFEDVLIPWIVDKIDLPDRLAITSTFTKIKQNRISPSLGLIRVACYNIKDSIQENCFYEASEYAYSMPDPKTYDEYDTVTSLINYLVGKSIKFEKYERYDLAIKTKFIMFAFSYNTSLLKRQVSIFSNNTPEYKIFGLIEKGKPDHFFRWDDEILRNCACNIMKNLLKQETIIQFLFGKRYSVPEEPTDAVVDLVKTQDAIMSLELVPLTVSAGLGHEKFCKFLSISMYSSDERFEKLLAFFCWLKHFETKPIFTFSGSSILNLLIQKGRKTKGKKRTSIGIIEWLLKNQLMNLDYKPNTKGDGESSPLDILLKDKKDIKFNNRVLLADKIGKARLVVTNYLRKQFDFSMLRNPILYMAMLSMIVKFLHGK